MKTGENVEMTISAIRTDTTSAKAELCGWIEARLEVMGVRVESAIYRVTIEKIGPVGGGVRTLNGGR